MIFISRYKNFKLGLRPTIKQQVNTSSGGEDVLTHKGVVVEFQNAVFDTKNWMQYSRPESPDRINVIQNEQALIDLMKASVYFGIDFFERKIESKAEKKARILEELAKLEAEEAAGDPDNAPEYDGVAGTDLVPDVKPVPARKSVKKAAKKAGKAKATKNKDSVSEL